ncbi:hypothetical protein BX600DRAFT_469227 [Xylariales sp. PMI_506]|nr:hypothetical protein BX600DRAFT_469227 [Xylariales sp. PMI_506]
MLNTAIAAVVASMALLVVPVSSISNVPDVRARATDSLTPWVTVGDNGTAVTITPVLTTISGTTTILSAAPNDITGSVFTQTNLGRITTSTGTAPMPTATATDGAGSFPVCTNLDGTHAPWCTPSDGANLYPGTTYYFIWDASYFSAPNMTVVVLGNYFNSTTGAIISQAFASEKMPASWGFWAKAIDSSVMQGSSGVNISVQLAALNVTSGQNSQILQGPTILFTNKPTAQPTRASLPEGAALYIGLPVILGFVIICLCGLCLWNRKHRRIELGNVMSRTRHGLGLGKLPRPGRSSRRDRKAAERVQLMEREIAAEGGQVYQDDPFHSPIGIPRRDSDALGSLAGTPIEDRRMDFHRPSTRDDQDRSNVFRDELKRQRDDGTGRL